MPGIAIINYGIGNVRSVQKALERVGAAASITSDPNQIGEADKLVLPGVGAFGDGIAQIRAAGLDQPILDHIRAGKPFLGICLGLQLLFTTGLEHGQHTGLNVLGGDVVPLPKGPDLRVPHMGWNQLEIRRRSPLLEHIPDQANVYFTHSYYAVPRDSGIVATETEYGGRFPSTIWHENIMATQFHPEKSQRIGLQILRNFVEWR